MFRPPTKYSEYLQDVRKSIDYILKRVNATTVTQIVAGTNVTISPASGTGVVTINASGGGGGGLPAGGTTGQILAKINNVDYNAEWIDNYALWTSTVKHEVKAGEAINKGQAVYVSSADGTNMIVSKASNASEATSSKTLGILAQSLAHNAKGFVITEGLLAGLDTSAAGAAGDPVWLGTDGNLLFGLANKPYAPANMVSIGVVTRKNSSNGEIFVRIQNGFELDELHNVDARNPNNNDGIFYNSTTQLWEHKPVSAVYATPTLAQVTTAGNTTTNAITVGGLVVDTNTLVVDAVNNRVGIGTTNPSTPLDVIGAGRFSGYVRSDFLNTHNNSKSIIGNPSNYTSIYDGSGIEAIRIVSNGNVLTGTTTDAGYKLDVNGTSRLNGNSLVTGNLTVNGSQNYFSALNGYIFFSRGAGTGINFSPANTINAASQSAVVIMDSIYGGVSYAGGTHTFNALAINTNIATGGSYNGIVRGIYYNPTLTSLTGVTHRAIETTSGDVILNTQTATTNAGYTTVAVGGSSGVYFQMYVGTNPSAQNLRGQIWAVGNNLLLNNPSSGYLGLYTTLYSGITVFPTTGNVHIGTGATDAGYKLDVNGTARVQGVITGSVAGGAITLGAAAANQSAISINGYFTGNGAIITSNYNGRSFNSVIGAQNSGITSSYNGNAQGQTIANHYFLATGNINLTDGAIDLNAFAFTPTIVSETGATIKAFSSTLSAASNHYNLYLSGTAQNYIAGNLGIGTPTPTDKLHIVDNTNGNKFGRISAGGTDASAAWVAQNDQVDNVVYRVFGSAVTGTQMGISLARSASLLANLGGSGKFLVGTFSSTDFVMGTGNQERMRLVDSTGNFLVGTTTDLGNKLEVSGTINATAYKINNTAGYTGILNIPTNPPGQQNVDIQSGIVVNIF